MTMIGIMLIVFAIAGLLIAYNTGRSPPRWMGIGTTRDEAPQRFADHVSIYIGLLIAGGLLITFDFLRKL